MPAAATASARTCTASSAKRVGQGVGGFCLFRCAQGSGREWYFDKLNDWLKSPKAFAPGTKMTFAGLSKPEDRANVIVYLNAQGSNLPLPPPPKAADASAAPADAPSVAASDGAAEQPGAVP